MNPLDICAGHRDTTSEKIRASRAPIHPTVAYVCDDPDHADSILAGTVEGFCYQRDGHPNSNSLRSICEKLHAPSGDDSIQATITSSGMAAMSLAAVSQLEAGDHVLLSNRLYGKTATLISGQCGKFGIESSQVDVCNQGELRAAFKKNTRMLVVETISNPQLRVADIEMLSNVSRAQGALLLVDNTFATPVVCQPLAWGADLVLESITKFMNGHGDVMLGMLAGRPEVLKEIDKISSTWGLVASPFACWLAERGMMTLAMRMQQAGQNSLEIASFLKDETNVQDLNFPGLNTHPDHAVAVKQFRKTDSNQAFANMISFDLLGGLQAATSFIRNSPIPFCASLGEMSSTLSHPASTSHRLMNSAEMGQLGISGGTIRLSIGCESSELLISQLRQSLVGLDS